MTGAYSSALAREGRSLALTRPAVLPMAVVCSAAALAGWVFTWALVSQHHAYYSNAFDLGFFDQIIWNTSQGRWFENSFVRYNFLGQHIEPVLLGYALIYQFWPHVEVLLVTQALVVAAAALPLYIVAERRLRHRWAAVMVAVAYLASTSLHQAVLFDFHPEVMGTLIVFSAAAALAAGRVAMALGVFALLFLLKEDAAIVGAGFAWLVWLYGRRWLALAAVSVCVLYFVGSAAAMSAERGDVPGDLQDRYGYLGSDVPSLVQGIVLRPDAVLGQIARPEVAGGAVGMLARLGGGLPLLSPVSLGAAPITLAHMLSLHPEQGKLALHYGALPFALLMLAAVDGIRRLAGAPRVARLMGTRSIPALASGLLAVSLLGMAVGSPLGLGFDANRYAATPHTAAVRSVLSQVPDRVAVSAQAGLVPHLSQREVVFEFPGIHEARVVVVDRTAWKSTYSQAAGYDRVLAELPQRGFRLSAAQDGVELYCLEGRCE